MSADQVLATLGKGTFGTVVKVEDVTIKSTDGSSRKRNHLALKIVINKNTYKQLAMLEINVLQKLAGKDPESKL